MKGLVRSWIEAPKFADFPAAMKNLAWQLGLDIRLDVDRGFFRENIRYELRGDLEKLDEFKRILYSSISEWQES